MAKTYTPLEIAHFFLAYASEKGDLISNKKLQKLLYYAQAWHLAFYEKPLFEEDIEAWIHGPVVRSVYEKYRRYKWEPIPPPRKKIEEIEISRSIKLFLKEVYGVYGEHSADYLERLTHSEKPWIEARGKASLEEWSNTPIKIKTMQKYYASMIEK